MNNDVNLACISNRALLEALRSALSNERAQLVAFLHALAEVDKRKLYAERAYSSLFAYCCGELKLSRDSAFRRIATARAGRRFPRVLSMLATGELHMSGVAKLGRHLTTENHDELLDAARNKSKEAIELLIATRFPSPAIETSIRPQPTMDGSLLLSVGAPPPALPPKPPRVVPTAHAVYTFQFSGSAEAKALLDRAKDLIGPQVEVGDVFERALTVLVEQLERQKFKKTDRPRTSPPAEAPTAKRYIPDAVKRAVSKRDEGRCTFVSADGRRCNATSCLEFDHERPSARGGASTVANVRLRCRTHNQLAAEQIFGRAFMDRKRAGSRAPISLPRQTKSPTPRVVSTPPTHTPSPAVARQIAIPKDVVEALRELGFSAKECRRLLSVVRPHMDGEASAQAWVVAALRASRVEVVCEESASAAA